MLINNLKNKKILIWGFGLEGKTVLDFLLKNNITNTIYVATRENINEKINNVIFIKEEDILKQDVEIVIKSSGISMYKPEIKELEKKNIVITHFYNILLAEILDYKKKNNKKFPKVIGISGSKGKTTTCLMCNHMLENLGYKITLLGNIGKLNADIITNFKDYDYIILEVSSYQCRTLRYPVDYSVILNLFPEHVDWHLTHVNYFNDKMLLSKYSKKSILPNSSNEVIARLQEGRDKDYFFFDTVSGFHITKDNKIYYINKFIEDTKDYPNINGTHFFKNLCAVLTIFKNENINVQEAVKTLHTFKMPEHRLEIFFKNEKDNTYFINDSISTIPEATIEALKSIKNENIYLILGGKDRKQDFSKLINEIKNNKSIKKVFLLGETGKTLKELFKKENYQNYFMDFNSLEAIVTTIKKDNLQNTTVILSPASSSYDMFDNFEKRGELFKELMLK